MEGQPKNPEFRINPEIFHPCLILKCGKLSLFIIKSIITAKIVYNAKTIFLISQRKHMLWVLKGIVSMRWVFEHPKQMFKLMNKNKSTILPSIFFLPWPMKK